MKCRAPDCLWAGRGGWVPSVLLEVPGGLGRPGGSQPPRLTLLTAVWDVAHDVSGDPQLLHVARSQGGPWRRPSQFPPGLLGVPAAEQAPHEGGHGPGLWGALGRVAQPKSLEQSGGGARCHAGAARERRG